MHESQFILQEAPAELRGLNASILADLHDLVSQFGNDVSATTGHRYLGLKDDMQNPMHVTVRRDGGVPVIVISPWPNGIRLNEAHELSLGNGGAGQLVIDKRFRLRDIEDFIRVMDERTWDLMRVENGHAYRPYIASDGVFPLKHSVELLFSVPDQSVSYKPGVTPEQVLGDFDSPELLVAVQFLNAETGEPYLKVFRRDEYEERQQVIQDLALERVVTRYGTSMADIESNKVLQDKFMREWEHECDLVEEELTETKNG